MRLCGGCRPTAIRVRGRLKYHCLGLSSKHLIDARLHDLRRTLRTGLAELGIPFEVAERVLNHAMPGLEAVYNRHNYLGEKRRALALWAEHVLAIAEEREATVVALRPAVA